MQKLILLFLFYNFFLNNQAQLTSINGDLEFEVATILSSIPGNSGDDFELPTSTELDDWGILLKNLLDHDYQTASNNASSLGYELIAFTDTVGLDQLYIMLKSAGSNHWGTYVYNPNYCRDLVIQSPHPKKDFNTGKQGIHVFKATNSKFFMLSGTSRCNHSSFSSCSGSTTVCSGSSESFRISDLAHQMNTIFQSTTDTLMQRNQNTTFLQLHGFSKLTSDPFVILSNGTRVTPSNDYIQTLKYYLEQEDPLFIDSIKVAHLNLSWNRLIAFSNVQGRLINSSSNVCNNDATISMGRFIHMEQEKTRLRDDLTGWTKVANAVNSTFNCSFGEIDRNQIESLEVYPNPATEELIIKSDEPISNIQVYDISGRLVNEFLEINESRINIAYLKSGIYFLKCNNSTISFIKK